MAMARTVGVIFSEKKGSLLHGIEFGHMYWFTIRGVILVGGHLVEVRRTVSDKD
jgi:hypothetical protein